MSITLSVIKTFNETVRKLCLNQETVTNNNNRIEAKLTFFEICEKLNLFREGNLKSFKVVF